VDKPSEHRHRKMIWSIAVQPSSYKTHAKKGLIGRQWRRIPDGLSLRCAGDVTVRCVDPWLAFGMDGQLALAEIKFTRLGMNLHAARSIYPLQRARSFISFQSLLLSLQRGSECISPIDSDKDALDKTLCGAEVAG
jgi:hypothetical protein